MLMTMRRTEEQSSFSKHISSSYRCGSSRIEGARKVKTLEPSFDEKFWAAEPTISSWADEVEAEEEEETEEFIRTKQVDVQRQTPSPQQQQLTAVVVDRPTTPPNEEEDGELTERIDGKSNDEISQGTNEEDAEGEPILFVGGILFTDLEKASKDGGKQKLKELKDLRIQGMIEILESFGEIKLLKRRWDRRYCHVIFVNPADTKRAFDCLTSAEERQKLKAISQKKLQAEGSPIICATSKYYVRWSTKEELAAKKGR